MTTSISVFTDLLEAPSKYDEMSSTPVTPTIIDRKSSKQRQNYVYDMGGTLSDPQGAIGHFLEASEFSRIGASLGAFDLSMTPAATVTMPGRVFGSYYAPSFAPDALGYVAHEFRQLRASTERLINQVDARLEALEHAVFEDKQTSFLSDAARLSGLMASSSDGVGESESYSPAPVVLVEKAFGALQGWDFSHLEDTEIDAIAELLDLAANHEVVSPVVTSVAMLALDNGDSLLRAAAARALAVSDPESAQEKLVKVAANEANTTAKAIIEAALRSVRA